MYTVNTTKKMLDNKDDKRFILNDGIHTLALGHHKLVTPECKSYSSIGELILLTNKKEFVFFSYFTISLRFFLFNAFFFR